MIHIQQVQGNVVVDDIKNGYTQQARSGMELGLGGNYLIATAQNSSVKLSISGKDFSLGASSFIRFPGILAKYIQASPLSSFPPK